MTHWLACMRPCRQLGMTSNYNNFIALTLASFRASSGMARTESGGVLTFACAQHLHRGLSPVHMDGSAGDQHGVLPLRSLCRSLMQPCGGS